MKKSGVVLALGAIAALAMPLAIAADGSWQYPARERGVWRATRYDQKYSEPGVHLPTPPPKDLAGVPAGAQSTPGGVHDPAGVAVGFSGGRAGRRTVREVERDSVRAAIRNLG